MYMQGSGVYCGLIDVATEYSVGCVGGWAVLTTIVQAVTASPGTVTSSYSYCRIHRQLRLLTYSQTKNLLLQTQRTRSEQAGTGFTLYWPGGLE